MPLENATSNRQATREHLPIKLTAISFQKNHKHPFLLHFEEMFNFCLLAKLSQTGELLIKDQVSGLEKKLIPTSLNATELYQEFHRVARQTQARYVLCGKIITPNPVISEQVPVNELEIRITLFDHQDNMIAWEEKTPFSNFLIEEQGRLIVQMERFNQLLQSISKNILQVLLPHQSSDALGSFSAIPITRSYQALQLLLQTQRKTTNSDKIRLLEQALKDDPKCELAYYHLAKIYRLERQYEQSVIHYRRALEVCQSGPHMQAQYGTDAGIACALLDRNDLALQWWQRAIQLYPTYINPYFNIANLYEDHNDYAKAAEFFQKAQDIAPDDFRTFYNLARIYAKLNAWDKALVQYQRQLEENDSDPWCHSDIATCYLNLGNIHKAAEHLEKTVTLDPSGEAGEYAKLILGNLSI